MIPVLIGQTGAGKTEIGRRLAAATHGDLLSIDDLRRQNVDAGMRDLGAVAIERAPKGRLILECTGAADDFEELLARLAEAGRRPFVVLLECSIESAMERIRNRPDWMPPRGGGSWAPHLRWTAMRLRQVPADLSIATDIVKPQRTAERIAAALRRAERNRIPHNRPCTCRQVHFFPACNVRRLPTCLSLQICRAAPRVS